MCGGSHASTDQEEVGMGPHEHRDDRAESDFEPPLDRSRALPHGDTRVERTSAVHGRSRESHAAVDVVPHLGAHPRRCRQASRGERDRCACPEEVHASRPSGVLRHDVDHEAGEREVGSGPPRALEAVDHSRQVGRLLADRGGHDRGGYRIGSGRAGAGSSAECTRCALRHRYRAPAPTVTSRNSTVNHWKYQWKCTACDLGRFPKVSNDLRKHVSKVLIASRGFSLSSALDVHCDASAPPWSRSRGHAAAVRCVPLPNGALIPAAAGLDGLDRRPHCGAPRPARDDRGVWRPKRASISIEAPLVVEVNVRQAA